MTNTGSLRTPAPAPAGRPKPCRGFCFGEGRSPDGPFLLADYGPFFCEFNPNAFAGKELVRMFAVVFSSKELYTPPTTAFCVLLEVVVVYCEIVSRYLLTGEGCILAVLDYCHVRYIIVTS